ncbi:MAG TPA: pitrilysin family protein [Alphaproteobacteria bacterium]|nr:pitrilysin family protein [Alphaproteobacteria bacterium]
MIRRLYAACLFVLLLAPAAWAEDVLKIERVVSPGGIEAWLVHDDAVPVISVEFAWRGGTVTDPAGKEGLVRLLGTLLDEGAGELDSQAFQTRLEDSAIGLSFSPGADEFGGSLTMLRDQRDEAFELLRLAVTSPRFDADAVRRMKEAAQQEIRRQYGSPDWLSRRALFDLVFPTHPYGRPSRGTVESVEAVTPEDMRGWMRQRIARDNLLIGVAGAITAAELGPALDRVFAELPAKASPYEIPWAEMQNKGRTVVVERPLGQAEVVMAQPGLTREDPDYMAAVVMNYILGGGGFRSRLTEEVREKRGLAYGVSSYLSLWDRAELLMVSTGTVNARVRETLDVVRAEWRRMAEGGITQAELDDAKTYLTGSYPLGFTSTGRIAGALLGTQVDRLGIEFLNRRNDLIQAVTLDDVNRVAKRLLKPDALTTVVVGRPEGVEGERVTIQPKG